MKRAFLISFLFTVFYSYSQDTQKISLGKVSLDELKMEYYEKDSSAGAVILDEKVHIYSNPKKHYCYTRDYYVRIKFFKKEAFDYATFKLQIGIPNKWSSYYKDEGLDLVEGITYNLSEDGSITKDVLDVENALVEEIDKNTNDNTYVFPNVKEGTVIEFRYTYTTRNAGILNQTFQIGIPKIKMDYELFNATDLNFYIRFNGLLKPNVKEIKTKEKCIRKRSCQYIHYVFDSIPAFYTEKFMTNKKNYISKLAFTQQYYMYSNSVRLTDWEAIDAKLKSIYRFSIGKTDFFKNRVPVNAVNNGSKLKIANEIYKFIQNHYTWNKRVGLYEGVDYDYIFKEKAASSSAINLALLNALRAFRIEANIGLLSTRSNGIITKLHPSPSSFDYLIIVVKMGDKEYLLDASRKENSFGQLPFECLNEDVRVFYLFNPDPDENSSRWHKVLPIANNKLLIKSKIEFSPEEEGFVGNMDVKRSGYYSSLKKEEIKGSSQEEYLSSIESENIDLEVNNYTHFFIDRVDKAFREKFDFSILLDEEETSSIKINPFLLNRYESNPFKMKERLYPIDYGYTRTETFYINFIIPEGYNVVKYPNDLKYDLPNKGGNYLLRVKKDDQKISILSQLQINRTTYMGQEYEYLKELYNTMIKAHSSLIELKKK